MEIDEHDWSKWHRAYDDPSSRLSRRLRVVQEYLRGALTGASGPTRIISMCAGEGRDVIGVLAGHPLRSEVAVRLVEADARNAEVARASARAAGLDAVQVVCADAAATESYEGAVPAEIILACGVFGNISDQDIERTIGYLPSLCAPNATVIWTRARERDRDIVTAIRKWFGEAGFDEVALHAPSHETFRVGVHRLRVSPAAYARGVHLFRFLR